MAGIVLGVPQHASLLTRWHQLKQATATPLEYRPCAPHQCTLCHWVKPAKSILDLHCHLDPKLYLKLVYTHSYHMHEDLDSWQQSESAKEYGSDEQIAMPVIDTPAFMRRQ